MLKFLEAELDRRYEQQPIIVVYEREQRNDLLKVLASNRFRYFDGATPTTLAEITDLHQGILVIERNECRGIDTRFAKDAFVAIIAAPSGYSEYLYLLGRGSRTRNISDGILITATNELPHKVIERLKSSNVSSMQELERLVRLIEEKKNNKQMIAALEEQAKSGHKLTRVQEVEVLLSSTTFGKVSKGFKY